MKRLYRVACVALALAAVSAASALSQTAPAASPPPSAAPQKSAAELEKLVAPVALYPDPLVATLLPAAAYPLEIVQAARLMKDPKNLPKVESQSWDKNVKELAKFPEVLAKMDADLDWTTSLGQAFVNQPQGVMDAIQSLRRKAEELGNLKTTPQQVVVVTNAVVEKTYQTQVVYVTNTVVQIQPSNPQVIYVPQYTTTVYTSPPPSSSSSDAAATLLTFGAGIALGAVIANNCDWHYGGVYWGPPPTVIVRPGYPPYHPPPPGYRPPPYYPPPGYRPPPPGYRPPGVPPPGNRPPGPHATTTQRWQPDSNRLNTAGGGPSAANTMQSRGWNPGTSATGGSGAVNRPTTTPATPGAGVSSRPSPASFPGQAANTAVTRPAGGSPPAARPAPRDSAFSGYSRGDAGNSRDFSNRGAASRGTMGGGSGARSGGGRSGGGGGGRGRR